MTALKIITPPLVPAVSLTEAKAYLRVDHPDEDAAITTIVGAAIAYADGLDGFLQRALMDQTYELTLDAFPMQTSGAYWFQTGGCATTNTSGRKEIKIPLPPLIQIVNIFYDDAAGVQQILDPAKYSIDKVNEPGWVVPVGDWPATFAGINAVRIRYRAGYVDTSFSPYVGAVPDDIKQAILLYASTMFDQRDIFIDGRVTPAPWSAEQLLRRRRIETSIA